MTGPSIAIDPAAVRAARTGFFALKLRCVRWRWKPTVTPIAQTRYMITKTATSDQWSHEFHSCQPTIPSAMNGRAVIVPVAIRSAVSFLTGWTSSRVGPGCATSCVVTCMTLPRTGAKGFTPATVPDVGDAVAHEVLVSGGSSDLGQVNLPDSQRPRSRGRRQEQNEQAVLRRPRRIAGGRTNPRGARPSESVSRSGVGHPRCPGGARRPREVADRLGQDARTRRAARRPDRGLGCPRSGAGAGPDSGAGQPDRRGDPRHRNRAGPVGRRRLRRGRLREADQARAQGAHPGRDPRTARGPDRAWRGPA